MLPLQQLIQHYWDVLYHYMRVEQYCTQHDTTDQALQQYEDELERIERYLPPRWTLPF